MALNYAAKYPVKGLFLVSPAYAFRESYLAQKYSDFNFPVNRLGQQRHRYLRRRNAYTLDKLPNAKLLVYKDAAHSSYVDQPEWFRTDLLKLYIKATI